MFLLDDILLFPVNGVVRLAERIEEAARQEFVNEAEAVRNELRETYMRLEAGKISEADFDARERKLLDRLDELETHDGDARDNDQADGDRTPFPGRPAGPTRPRSCGRPARNCSFSAARAARARPPAPRRPRWPWPRRRRTGGSSSASIDPAHSLADSLAGQPPPANLELLEIDAAVCFRKFKEAHAKHLRQVALRGTFLDDEDVTHLLDLSMPGLDEVMAFDEIAALVERHAYECIIVDTAPTGHTLRFFEMPRCCGSGSASSTPSWRSIIIWRSSTADPTGRTTRTCSWRGSRNRPTGSPRSSARSGGASSSPSCWPSPSA